jgi:hypothetical protein
MALAREAHNPKSATLEAPQVQLLIRGRIIELRRVKASDLAPNEKNWRLHPESQRGGRGILKEIGHVGAALGVIRDAKMPLLDGHLGAQLSSDMEIPALMVDLNDAECSKVFTRPNCEPGRGRGAGAHKAGPQRAICSA